MGQPLGTAVLLHFLLKKKNDQLIPQLKASATRPKRRGDKKSTLMNDSRTSKEPTS